ncbi:hypothetical protein ACIQM0_24045 [Streptomyces sp. NPDC091387]|uniref:hypothetical protein n=1 Tax=Streptomyces sp. NPDC091387 TaxID=3365998 RepID=UPI00382AAEE0
MDGLAPKGCVGAPVFVGLHLEDDRFKLVCLGVLLPSEGLAHPVATFDLIRAAVRELPVQSGQSAAGTGTAPAAKSRWWRGRR